MKKKINILLAIPALMVGHSLLAYDPVELKQTYTFSYPNWFADKTDAWSDGKPTESGKSYRVSDGYQLQVGTGGAGRDVEFLFPGDSLIIGDKDGIEATFCHGGAADISIPNLVMANGRYWSYYTWGYSAFSTMRGAATVVSPSSNPFRINPVSHSAKHYGLAWHMVTSGSEGTGLLIAGNGGALSGRMDVYSSNPDYRGVVTISGKDLTLGVSTSDSLGGPLQSFNEKAFVIKESAILEALSSGIVLSSSDNRGIYVEASGGKVNVPLGNDFTVGWPISGEGVLTKIGAGTLYLSSRVSVAAVEVAEGTVAASPGATVTISKLRLNGGILGVGVGCGILVPSSVEVVNGGRILVKILGEAVVGTEIPFLTAKKGTFKKDDFYVCAGTGAYGAPFGEVKVFESGENDIFSLVVVPVVETEGNGVNNAFYASEGTHWSDGNPVGSGAAYLVGASSVSKTFQDAALMDVSDYVFPGQSLTFAGVNANISAKLSVFSETFEGNLRFYDGTKISFGRMLPVIKGNIEVNTTVSGENGLMVTINAATTATVESVISGTGWMFFNNYSSAGTVGTIEFTATNTYTGGMSLYGNTKFVCLRISNERNLGANPTVFNESALYFQAGGILHPKGSVTIDDPNRGVMLNSANWITTDEGATTSILSPVFVKASSLCINGGGTLFFGGVLSRSGTSMNNTFTVENGFLKGGAVNTFDVVKLVFGENGGLAVDRVTDSSDSRSVYGTILSDPDTTFPAKLKVRIDYGDDLPSYDEPVPFLSVPASFGATLEGNIEFVDNLDMGKWYLVRDNVIINGESFVRYSAKYEKGFAVILR